MIKVIVSHDVDHISFWEHKKDLMVPKYIARNFLELVYGQISLSEINGRFKNLFSNKWHNLDELMIFNKGNHIPATFFFAVSNGTGLAYSLSDAEFWVKKTIKQGFDVGVHGIAFDNYTDIKNEHSLFIDISGKKNFGIRMHYLNNAENTLNYLSKSGYLYDSTLYGPGNPYKTGNMWEFPLLIMDVDIIRKNSSVQNQNLKQCKEATMKMINDAIEKKLRYLTINLHDRYFTDCFKTWKEWYIWLIQYLKGSQFEFISYHKAVKELDQES